MVDNNSTDNTAQVVADYQQSWPQSIPLRYLFEPQQGAHFARQQAVQAAQGALVGFLDDDNLPESNWIAAAYAFAQEYPQAGAYGSQIHGEFEVEPPPNFDRIASFLAITERGSQPLFYDPQKKMLPPSAGLVIRKAVWLAHVPEKMFLTGKTGRSLLSSEDTEVLARLQVAGWEIWYNPAMQIYHKIPQRRLEREALLELMRGIGLARYYIRIVRTPAWFMPILFPAYLANDLRKLLRHWLRYRSQLSTDVVAACELEFLRTSLISPFYLWAQYWKK